MWEERNMNSTNTMGGDLRATWQKVVKEYQKPVLSRSLWMLVNSIGGYLIFWALMIASLSWSYWLTLLLAVPAAGFMVRVFIIFHDCGHGSFFKSRKANTLVGIITGLITFTPFHQWRHHHAIHHATAGDLDRRGTGDVLTLTVDEYLALPRIKQLGYRIYRNPLVMFLLGPTFVFLIGHRIPSTKIGQLERRGVWWTNLALAGIVTGLSLLIGFKNYLLIQLPILIIGTGAGVWLFYVQHQFEEVYWERHPEWEFDLAGIYGSSYYHLPKLLQWFSGNIGFHHLHHLSPRIPNYNLEKCQQENPIFHQVQPITLGTSLQSLKFRLWDEDRRRMIGFGQLKHYQSKPSPV
jgi:omega-6 fatty acid desaturase (delta-12 desaturase)